MLSLSFILFYYSETAFWSFYNPGGRSLLEMLQTWMVYFTVTYVCWTIWIKMQAKSAAAALIVGCLYGWIAEGKRTLFLNLKVLLQILSFNQLESFGLQWLGTEWKCFLEFGTYQCQLYLPVLQKVAEARAWKLTTGRVMTGVLSAVMGMYLGFFSSYWWKADSFADDPGFIYYLTLSNRSENFVEISSGTQINYVLWHLMHFVFIIPAYVLHVYYINKPFNPTLIEFLFFVLFDLVWWLISYAFTTPLEVL